MIHKLALILGSAFAPITLKQEVSRLLSIESYSEALDKAEELKKFDDAEALFLAVSSYARNQNTQEALKIIKNHQTLLKKESYYFRCLEELALSVFHANFHLSQEPIKLAALASIAQESDARILPLLLDAFDSPSMKVKMLTLRGLSSFADEKVKRLLFDHFNTQHNAVINLSIARLFALWQDKRILPVLFKKLSEDTLSLDEKIHYIHVLKELSDELSEEQILKFSRSPAAALRMLACYFIGSSKDQYDQELTLKLLNDSNLWVKESALNTVIKKKIHSEEVQKVIGEWKKDKSKELIKGYFYYGLVNHDKTVIDEFTSLFKESDVLNQKKLAGILYASGPGFDDLGMQLIQVSSDPLVRIHLGLYLLAGKHANKSIDIILKSLNEVRASKLFLLVDHIYPFFVIDSENNSSVSISAGQRRSMDQHLRLKIFHLLAIKKHPSAKDVLKQLLKTDLFELSLDAMVHFWEHFGYEDSEYLKNILQDQDPDLRLKAALVLNFLDYDKSIRKYLMDSFPKQPYAMQIQILFALSKYREDDVIDFYLKMIDSKYPVLQAISAGCLFTTLYR